MGKMSREDLQKAEEIAQKNKEAASQIEQAGRGLHVAIQQCLGGNAGLPTVDILAAVQAYTADAMRVILEMQISTAPENRILVPKGKG
jgi:hypothetical protein